MNENRKALRLSQGRTNHGRLSRNDFHRLLRLHDARVRERMELEAERFHGNYGRNPTQAELREMRDALTVGRRQA